MLHVYFSTVIIVIIHRNIIHMDIKPPNFILTKGQLKVIDLGCAEQIPQNQDFILSNSSKGTEGYMAPECFVTYKNKLFQYSTRWVIVVNVRCFLSL